MSNDLKKEKEAILGEIFSKIDSINDEGDLREIYDEVSRVNELLDIHDSKLENLLDKVSELLTTKIKNKIKTTIRDLFDKYDKKNKNGIYVYSDEERLLISNFLKKIDEICNRSFWDRFKKVLGLGL